MPGSLSLTVGAVNASIPLSGTNATINNVILRFLKARGVVTDGLSAVQVGEAALTQIKKIVLDHSIDQQRQDEIRNQQIALEAQIATDNNI